jgi:hypothetical protein
MVYTRAMKKKFHIVEEPDRSHIMLGLFPLFTVAASIALTIITLFGLRAFFIVMFSLLGIIGVPVVINLIKI